MIPTLRDLQGLRIAAARHAVHQSVLARDPSRPPACQVLPQRLRPAHAGERVSPAFLDQGIDPLQDLGVRLLPAEILGPAFRIENDLQG